MRELNNNPSSFDKAIAECELAGRFGFSNIDEFRNSGSNEEPSQIKADDLVKVAKFDSKSFLPNELVGFVCDTSYRLSVPRNL